MTRQIAVYKRVSTDRQETHMQQVAVEQWLAANAKGCEVTYYEDRGISGKTTKRPEYQRMLQDIHEGKINCVVCYRLDRLGRDAITMLRQLMDWLQHGVEFFAVDQPMLQLGSDNPMRLTIATIFAEIAQLERETISRRVKDGLVAARKRGKKLGAPVKVTDQIAAEMRQLRAQGQTQKQIAWQFDVSETAVRRACS